MKRAILIGAIAVVMALAVLAGVVLEARRAALRTAKAQAIEKYSTNKEVLNAVPPSRSESIPMATAYTNELAVYTGDQCLAFPADRFSEDSKPSRRNRMVHHSRYRVMIMEGTGKGTWGSIMEDLNETNLYSFFSDVLNTTEHAIAVQPDIDSLQRHLVFLTAKEMLVPASGESSMIEFKREDLKGFIFGEPTKTRFVYVYIFIEKAQRFVVLGIIKEKPIQMSDIEELISVLRVRPNVAVEVTDIAASSRHEHGKAQAE
jgi:hypothetical protein